MRRLACVPALRLPQRPQRLCPGLISGARASRICVPFCRPAFSYIEAVISMSIMAVGLTAGMRLYGSYARGKQVDSECEVARELAMGLASEIVGKPFEDPTAAAGSFGLESGESNRASFDDVDDFDTWSESPPALPGGAPLAPGCHVGYTRSVVVDNVVPTALATTAADGSTAAKCIRVKVERNGRVVTQLTIFRFRNGAYD